MQASVTGFRPFCDRTNKFVHRPWNIRSPNTSQIQTFQNNLWANCRQFSYWLHFLLLNIDGHPCMELRLCITAKLFYSQVRNIFQRISLHDLPCRGTKKILFLHQVSLKPWSTVFFGSSRNPRIELICRLPQYLCWFDTLLSANQNIHGQEMMLVLPDQRLSWKLSKSVPCFLSCLPVWYRPHTLIRLVLLLGWRINIPV